MLDGYTRVCGVIGNPVEHTLSPLIHNTIAEYQKENLVYVPMHVPTGMVEEAVRGAFALNMLGINVTVPYKSDVIPWLKELDPLAERIGAVNTLVRTEDGYKGYNTDMPGLYRAFMRDHVVIENEEIIILGAGGVARAVAMLLAQKNAAGIWLLNRTVEKAEAVAREVNDYAGRQVAHALALSDYRVLQEDRGCKSDIQKKYLAIQATTVGMYPGDGVAVLEEPDFYRMLHTGYDLVYKPSVTRFMELVEKQGGRAFNGGRMLLYQGIIAYELWTGRIVEESLADIVYERMRETWRI